MEGNDSVYVKAYTRFNIDYVCKCLDRVYDFKFKRYGNTIIYSFVKIEYDGINTVTTTLDKNTRTSFGDETDFIRRFDYLAKKSVKLIKLSCIISILFYFSISAAIVFVSISIETNDIFRYILKLVLLFLVGRAFSLSVRPSIDRLVEIGISNNKIRKTNDKQGVE